MLTPGQRRAFGKTFGKCLSTLVSQQVPPRRTSMVLSSVEADRNAHGCWGRCCAKQEAPTDSGELPSYRLVYRMESASSGSAATGRYEQKFLSKHK